MVDIQYNTSPPEKRGRKPYKGKWEWLYTLIQEMETGTWADVNVNGVRGFKEPSMRAAAANAGKMFGYKIKVRKTDVHKIYKIGKFV